MTTKSTCSAMLLPVNAEEWIQIFPAGTTVGRDGRGPYLLADPEAVITASRSTVDLFIDRDHAADLAAKGTEVKAAGWIKELKVEAGAIFARIEWTPPAQEQLKNREYRYISPTFLHEPGGRVTRILRASLTNDPNFEMKAVAAADREFSPPTKDSTMEKLAQDLAALLGLEGDNISPDAIIDAAKSLQTIIAAIKADFEVPAEAVTAEAIIEAIKAKTDAAVKTEVASQVKKATAAISKGEPDPTKYVSVSIMQELQTKVANLENEHAAEKATASVDAALKAGKLMPVQKDWALSLASKDPKAFADYVEKTPSLIRDSGLASYSAETAAAQAGLSPLESTIAHQLGVKPDALKAELKKTA
ncbi:MAG: phage protease [Alphaproteobacteria bacterium]|nr:phage protease [Alphaproteobacteria bacterium]